MRIILTKKCGICGKEFEKPLVTSKKQWEKRINCSMICQAKYWTGKKDGRKKTGTKNSVPAWNKGIPQPESVKRKLSKALKVIAKKKGFGKWMLGKKASLESRRKNSEAMKKRIAEGKHNFYIDGRTPINKLLRHSVEYKLWRESVFKRDNWTCQHCGARNGNGKKIILHADHIKPFAYYPELRFEISNGRTLCIDCHKLTDTYKGKAINYR